MMQSDRKQIELKIYQFIVYNYFYINAIKFNKKKKQNKT